MKVELRGTSTHTLGSADGGYSVLRETVTLKHCGIQAQPLRVVGVRVKVGSNVAKM